ncbi:hypothetical protein VR010_00660 [Actinomycetaceae bacterium L2_0104]
MTQDPDADVHPLDQYCDPSGAALVRGLADRTLARAENRDKARTPVLVSKGQDSSLVPSVLLVRQG